MTSPDAQCHDAALDAVALHRMKEASSQHGARRTDRMTVCDGAAFDVHNIFGEAEFACYRDSDRGEGLVDLDALNVGDLPPGAGERLAHGGNGPSPNIPGSTAPMP